MRSGATAVVLGVLLASCSWWRPEPIRKPRPPEFPPPIGAPIEGPLLWAEAHPKWGEPPLRVHFDAEPLESIGIAAWAWDFGDGSPIARRRNPVHTYPNEGAYEAHVWVRDTAGRVGMDVVTIRVETNLSPAWMNPNVVAQDRD
jgi:hypothetical protein